MTKKMINLVWQRCLINELTENIITWMNEIISIQISDTWYDVCFWLTSCLTFGQNSFTNTSYVTSWRSSGWKEFACVFTLMKFQGKWIVILPSIKMYKQTYKQHLYTFQTLTVFFFENVHDLSIFKEMLLNEWYVKLSNNHIYIIIADKKFWCKKIEKVIKHWQYGTFYKILCAKL